MPTFINPSILFGTLLVGIPIVLHLIMRQQPQRLVFPALRLIQQRRDANQRRLKLRHLILLLLRCAAIFLFALAIARPEFHSDNLPAGNAPVAAAVVFDTSPRMEYRQLNQSRLDVAQETGQWLVDQLPADSDVVILDSISPRSDFDIDRSAAKLRLDQLNVTPAARPLVDLIVNAYSIVAKSDKAQKEIFVFSDLSLSAWEPNRISRLGQLLKRHPEISLHLYDVGVTDPRNHMIGDIELSAQTVSTNSTVEIGFDVLNIDSGNAAKKVSEKTVELYLIDEKGTPQRRGLETVRVEGNIASRVTSRLSVPQRSGIHHGYVKFARNDNVPIDDIRYFTIEAKPAWRVLLAAPRPATSYTRLLHDALSPYEYRKRGLAQFDCDIVTLDELARRNLDDYQAVWLLDPKPLSVEVWQRLSRYVTSGGAVAFAFGRNAQRGDTFNSPGPQELLPAKLTRQWKMPDGDLWLAPENLEHPILSQYKAVAMSVPWDLNPIYKFWQLGPLDDGARVIIPFSNGQPALVEQTVGQGLVLTMNTPLSDALNDRRAWNHLVSPLRQSWPGFLLVVEMTHYLIGNSRSEWNYHVGETAELRLAQDDLTDKYLLTSPSGDVSRVTTDQRDHTLRVSDTAWPGHYELQAGGAAGSRLGFSVNLRPDATRLERVTPEQFQESLGDLTPPIVRNQDELQKSRKLVAGRGSWEAYPWLLLIIVFVIAAEQLMSSLFYQRGRGQMNIPDAAAAETP